MTIQSMINEAVKDIAKKIVIAAQTAPKGKGEDNIVIKIVEGSEIEEISKKLTQMREQLEIASFTRDAQNILLAEAMILIGTKIKPLGLKKCGMCGFENCEKKSEHPKIPCAFNTGDLGIAIGSAVSVAMDCRVDNRIMYTVGQAAIAMGILGNDVPIVYAIPLSATSKNPFFDRK